MINRSPSSTRSELHLTKEDDAKPISSIDPYVRRAQQNDRTIDEMDPPKTFQLSLRPYQKQALQCVLPCDVSSASSLSYI